MTDEAVPPVERFVELPHETQMFLSELSHEDIARSLGVTHDAARKRHSRALAALGRALGDTLR